MGKFREKFESWLAPENARNGMPTYIPRQRLRKLTQIDEGSIREESSDEHEVTEDIDAEVSAPKSDNRAQSISVMCGGLALQYQASLQNQRKF